MKVMGNESDAAMGEIRKVKAVSPSPFYDEKYHPPLIEQPGCFISMIER